MYGVIAPPSAAPLVNQAPISDFGVDRAGSPHQSKRIGRRPKQLSRSDRGKEVGSMATDWDWDVLRIVEFDHVFKCGEAAIMHIGR